MQLMPPIAIRLLLKLKLCIDNWQMSAARAPNVTAGGPPSNTTGIGVA